MGIGGHPTVLTTSSSFGFAPPILSPNEDALIGKIGNKE